MNGSRSHAVKLRLVWHDHALDGSTVVEATTVLAAVEATLQLLREIPDPRIVDSAIELSSAPWALGEQRSVETVTITAPARRIHALAELTWTGSHGIGTLRALHEDWPIGLRNALAYHMDRPSPPLAALLDRNRSERPIPFMLYGMVARLMVVPPRLR
jgi:hypothetical protein